MPFPNKKKPSQNNQKTKPPPNSHHATTTSREESGKRRKLDDDQEKSSEKSSDADLTERSVSGQPAAVLSGRKRAATLSAETVPPMKQRRESLSNAILTTINLKAASTKFLLSAKTRRAFERSHLDLSVKPRASFNAHDLPGNNVNGDGKEDESSSTTSGHDTDDNEGGGGGGNIERNIERDSIRMDGLEVYAVVSALTSATLYQCFESFDGKDWGIMWEESRYLHLAADVLYLFSSATGILAGLHATLIFSLMTMYGRTAIGMGREDAFTILFEKTGLVRLHGFLTFIWSLYAFLIQVGIMITMKTPMSLRLLFFLGIAGFMVHVFRDTQTIMESASAIFIPREAIHNNAPQKQREVEPKVTPQRLSC